MRHIRSVKTGPMMTGKGEVGDRRDAVAAIRRGLTQARKGMGRSVDEVFDDIEKECAARRA
ncbi:MAG: hypothetical protein M3O35_21570 [Acidobacteriota bacterium]|nr:hypothetical protein [Acidobacteriota bacterium]